MIPKVIPNHAVWGMYYINHKLPYSTFSLDVYSQTGFFFGTRSPPSIVTVITMAMLGGTFQASNRVFLDTVVPPIAILFALLLLYLIYKCSRAIASSTYCSKSDIALVKYSELLQTADDDDVKYA